MTYTSSTRDRYRLAVWSTTSAVAAGAIAATGWVAGAAAHDRAGDVAAQQAGQDAQAQKEYAAWLARYGSRTQAREARPRLRQRPVRTRVTTRFVTATAPTAVVGPGGTVSTPTSSSTATAPSTTTVQAPTGSSGASPQTSTPPPPPPPPPAPTSGS